MGDIATGFEILAPAWRIRRLREHLKAQIGAGRAAGTNGDPRKVPEELEHRAELRCWRAGWDRVQDESRVATPRPPTERQLEKIARWEAGAGRLPPAQGALRRAILDEVADDLLSKRPLAFGAIAAAHRETTRRCREAGLPAPRASRYRLWLKLSRGV